MRDDLFRGDATDGIANMSLQSPPANRVNPVNAMQSPNKYALLKYKPTKPEVTTLAITSKGTLHDLLKNLLSTYSMDGGILSYYFLNTEGNMSFHSVAFTKRFENVF